jgi:hypothetical protein
MKTRNLSLALAVLAALAIADHPSHAQVPKTPIAASAPTAVPSLVPFSGTAAIPEGQAGQATITFQIFKEETAGESLWTEIQSVAIDPTGHYKVQLGATNPNGLPTDLFTTGEARWLEVQIAGESPQPRVLLASVPYALKAGDATTLGGLPASAYALAGSKFASTVAPDAGPDAIPNSTVTTPGGTSGYLPMFTGTTTIADSILYASSTGIGVGDIPNSTAVFDVNGKSIWRGLLNVSRQGTATATTGYDSWPMFFQASAYNSSTKAAALPAFQLQAEPAGNNTATPAGTFNLLYNSNGGTPTETGLSFNGNGTINFAPGQKFPGTGTGNGTITEVGAGTFLTGGGNSGNVTLSLNLADTDGRYPRLAASNTFTGNQTFNGNATFPDLTFLTGGFTSDAPSSIYSTSTGLTVDTTESGSIYGQLKVPSGDNQYGWAIEGAAYHAYSGVYGYADDTSQAGVIGSGNIGLYALSDLYGAGGGNDGTTTLTAALYAQAGTISGSGANDTRFPAAVFADGGAQSSTAVSQIGVLASTDDNNAVFLTNNSATQQTINAANNAEGGSVLIAQGTGGHCGIDGSGDLSCTGTISGSNVTADKRTLTTYGVQSAENWYEDYGSGQLHSGSAQITLDPGFAQTVNTTVDYHVFLTPKGDCKGLYVANETAIGFEVHELGRGTAGVAFDYKIVAKRKGYEQFRLQDLTEKVQQQAEERLKRQATTAHSASRPTTPPVPQHAQLKPIPLP